MQSGRARRLRARAGDDRRARGSIRLLAFPELAFPPVANLKDTSPARRRSCTRGSTSRRELAHLKQVLGDEDGRIRYDIRRKPGTKEPLGGIGDADEALGAMRSSRVDLGMGCGCMLPVLVAAAVLLTVVPLEAIEQMANEARGRLGGHVLTRAGSQACGRRA